MDERIYVVIRKDLKMRRGKEIAQAVHAVCGLGTYVPFVVTMQAQDESTLQLIERQAAVANVPCHIQRDAGHTEVEPGTPTALALGPAVRGQVPILEQLQLY